MKKLGLLGKNISYSFSQNYFTNKFKQEKNNNAFSYENFDIQNIEEFTKILQINSNLIGLNVTIPYKETIIPFLDELSQNAKEIGAVNTIRISPNGKLFGDNTDYFGFNKSLKPLLKSHHKKALILGTGGAAKAVAFGLKKLNIESLFVSRLEKESTITYNEINAKIFDDYQIIINCTPLGTTPKTELFPDIPYSFFTPKHIAFDLIYNPEKTVFLEKAENKGAIIKNGYDMLVFQAEKAWEIWIE
ncbi:shikimate dehydrogenase family protein [Flavobacterium psychrophilum]|uniref:shikimate dehydrogenase family protein n=1 Tax=Flavobacterium psychrophilum TaxID=96345 RepID=UPI000B7C5230|nr:shikimate dehydrogenase [Flavobacterium psychrophilum]MBM4676697.1 shikimate dehydrogenase [Flavobacterium psychrophilum]MCB5989779.1 shikimate dehydrogenase [Flavobacterium psychrophilum]MCB5998074.1 shikimate dehydrogenase [Flavobacterium psychrophilum]MCB6015320.1 shikimate dehydrogenase [Flavobacterium psychrophilum]MCB6020651.1 shikimate dehydrogenase [Flavobacterium psychrophilum]